LKQITLFEEGILQRPQSKFCDITKKKTPDYVEHWSEIHKDTNWKDVSYDLKHGKKSNKQIIFKMVGTGEPKEDCGRWVTEGCDNYLSHPSGKAYVENKRLTCKSAECSVCWDSWLIRESSRVTERIEKFRMLSEREGFRSTKPIHVIVSPPKWLWNISWVELKKSFRKMVKRAGIIGGVSMFHAFRLSSDGETWFYSPHFHFHMIGYGWVINTKKISSENGWVIKNKGIRKSSTGVYSTVSYLLSHTAIAKGIHSVTWFGDLSYSAKYAFELKRQKEESDFGKCPYCSQYLVLFEVRGTDRPPPHEEWFGLMKEGSAYPVETFDEMLDRKIWVKNKIKRESKLHVKYWNEDCKKAWRVADDLIKKLSHPASTYTTTADTATTTKNHVLRCRKMN